MSEKKFCLILMRWKLIGDASITGDLQIVWLITVKANLF